MNWKSDDDQLYHKIKNHPQVKHLSSKIREDKKRVNGKQQKQFKYIYVEDPKYQLGSGSFGKVYQCYHVDGESPTHLALKIIKVPSNYSQIQTIETIVTTSRQEILALIKLRKNNNIIRIQDVIRNGHIIYIMLEYCNQKDLAEYYGNLIKQKKVTSEIHVRYFFKQILSGFEELEKHQFIHRDIKPSNILVKNNVLKVADFGYARQLLKQCQNLEEHVGTRITASPQILFHEDYSSKCDIYSLGVILYWLLYQQYPFRVQPTKDDFKQNQIKFIPGPIQKISDSMIDLVRRMLAYNESDRIQWKQLFTHPLFNGDSLLYFEQIRQQLDKESDYVTGRESYGRHIEDDYLDDSEQFLQMQIPRSMWKYLQEIEGQDKISQYCSRLSLLQSSPGFRAHLSIKQQYNHNNLKVKFYMLIVNELYSFDSPIKNEQRIQILLVRDLIIYGLNKFIIYTLSNIQAQLNNQSPAHIFKKQLLNQAKKSNLHQSFVERVIERVKGAQLFVGSKINKQQKEKLQQKCKDLQIFKYMMLMFKEINQGILSDYLNLIKNCIIELIYLIKPWINKTFRKELMEKDSAMYKSIIIMVHHLLMFSIPDQVFPPHFSHDFAYESFLEKEQFKSHQDFEELNKRIIKLIKRFQ